VEKREQKAPIVREFVTARYSAPRLKLAFIVTTDKKTVPDCRREPNLQVLGHVGVLMFTDGAVLQSRRTLKGVESLDRSCRNWKWRKVTGALSEEICSIATQQWLSMDRGPSFVLMSHLFHVLKLSQINRVPFHFTIAVSCALRLSMSLRAYS